MRAPLTGAAGSPGSHLWKPPVERCDVVLRAGRPLLRRLFGIRCRTDRAGRSRHRATTVAGPSWSSAACRR
ncbi:hypothetical protein KTU01_07500 [Kocuria turfanensis]|uniref:Uncharacterized protein n=1 Tax=Kocuria turfanensis TaxID=388357 RepID=A0A512IAH3_9MICC|nr:hypothetical protein KTU01_07500 [Kocuria turfanensis]